MKNKTKKVLIFVMLLIFLIVLKTPDTYSIYKSDLSTTVNLTITDANGYVINFNTMGGSTLQNPTVVKNANDTLGPLEYPTKSGEIFDGWYTDPTGGTKVTGNTIVTSGATYYAHYNPIICKPAESGTLHTESNLTYGIVPNSATLATGFAYDCKVSSTGGYTERFYYLTDDEYGNALFIYSNNTHYDNSTLQTICNADGVTYNDDRLSNLGPTNAYLELPTTTDWDNVSLHNLPRQIVNEDGDSYTAQGNTPTFAYTGRAARFVTTQEVERACNITVNPSATSPSHNLNNCLFLLEHTSYKVSSCRSNYWTETPGSLANKVFRIQKQNNVVAIDITPTTSGFSAVRPLIEVPLGSVERYGNPNQYTIDFNSQGGSTVNSINRYSNETYGTLPTPTKQYYAFDGWHTDPVNESRVTSSTSVSGDIVLYAHWVLDITNATVSPSSISVNIGSTGTITVTGPEGMESYTFTSNDTSVATVTSGGVVTGVAAGTTTITITGNKSGETITVNVEITGSHTITYNTHGGSAVVNSTVNHNATISPFPTTSQAGKVFVGWFTLESGGTEVTASTPITSDMTLHAHWDDFVCRPAVELHTTTCERTSDGCGAIIGNGNPITYGTLVNGTIKAGDAFDCKVTANGGYTERFYYIRSNNGTATLIHSTNVDDQTKYAYDSSGENWHGPVTGYQYLPSTTSWNNTNIIAPGTRQIVAENGATETSGGTIESFTYTNKAARFLTYEEVQVACGTNSITTTGVLGNCMFLLENLGYFEKADLENKVVGYWLENPNSISSEYAWSIYGFGGYVDDYYVYNTPALSGVRPVIDIPTNYLDSVMPDTYDITLNYNYGLLAVTRKVVQGEELGSLPTLTREGYIFDGWYTLPAAGTEVTSATVPDDDLSYYAHWTPDITNATVSPSSISINIGSTETISVSGPANMESYTFTSNGTSVATVTDVGVVSGVGAGTTTITITGSRSGETITVNVEVISSAPSKIHVTFDHNDGLFNTTEVDLDSGSTIGEFPTVTRTDFILDGWYTLAIGGDPISTETVPSDGDTYYAHWIPGYTITFDSDDGTSVDPKVIPQGSAVGDLTPYPTKTNYYFAGWFTGTNGSGTRVTSATVPNANTTYHAYWIQTAVAEIEGINYPTLQAAVNDVPTDDVEVTIKLLQDTAEFVTVSADQNIRLNLQTYALMKPAGKYTTLGPYNALINYGTVSIYNGTVGGTGYKTIYNEGILNISGGTIYSTDNNAIDNVSGGTVTITGGTIYANGEQGALNNVAGGTFIISGGTIYSTSTSKGQALYNDGGTVNISGGTIYNKSQTGSKARAAVHNTSKSTSSLTITGGTITSEFFDGVKNDSTVANSLVIGTQNGVHDTAIIVIQGYNYGVETSSNIKFYDGILKGFTAAINNDSRIPSSGIETGATKINGTETIGTDTYNTLYYQLASSTHTITYNTHGGVAVANSTVTHNQPISPFPTTTQTGKAFAGWFTLESGGTEVTATTPITSDMTLHAHWDDYVCRPAYELHTAECTNTGSGACRGQGYYPEGSKGTSTITYGTLVDSNSPKAGDAYDCKVSTTGGYTERFYYVTSNDGKAVFIHSESINNTKYDYDSSGENWHGPTNAYQYLPSTSSWNMPGIIAPGTRTIINNEDGNTTNNGSNTIESFTYTNKAARLLTLQEVKTVCGNSSTGSQNYLENCNWLLDNVDKFETNNGLNGYWLETPSAFDGVAASNIDGFGYVTATSVSTTIKSIGVRPVIEIPLSYINPDAPETYDITLSYNYGLITETRIIVQGEAIGSLPTLTRSGYIFDGWYTLPAAGTEVTAQTVPDDDLTYYAHWIPDITFATVSPSSISINTGATETITVSGPANMESYTFTSNDTSVATVTSAGVVSGVGAGTTTITITGLRSNETTSVSVTVTASVGTHTIIYNTHGGEAVANSIVNHNETISPFPTTSQTGKVFVGWFTLESGGTEITSSTPITSDMTLHAHWNDYICKRARILDEVECGYTSGSDGCYAAGYSLNGSKGTTTITYGTRPNSTTLAPGFAYDCKVSTSEGYDYRFYYVRTVDGKAALVSNTNFEGSGGQGDTEKYTYDVALTKLPTTTQWNNVSEINGYAARLIQLDDLYTACGSSPLTSTGSLDTCEYFLQDSGFESSSTGRSATWIEDYNSARHRYNTKSRLILTVTGSSINTSENAVRPVIEIPIEYIEPYVAEYEITYNYNDEIITTTKDYVVQGSALGNLPTPTRTGYIFDGWYTLAIGGTQVNSETVPSADTTYFAHWTPDITNATASPSSISVNVGSTETISVSGPANMESYSFTSNNTNVAAVTSAGVVSGVGAGTTTITITGSRSDETIIVNVEVSNAAPLKYHVTFDHNDGLFNTTEVEVDPGSALEELPTVTRADCIFDGWYTLAIGGDPISTETVPSDGDTYYAHWIPGYTITFDSQGGTSVEQRVIPQGSALGDLTPYPTKENRFFAGWFTGTSGSGTMVTSTTVPTANTTYHAYWINSPHAEIDGIFFNALSDAILSVPNNGVETTIKILTNLTGKLTIETGQNIKFNLQNYTINNTNSNTLVNKGTLKIYNGTISNSSGYGAIDNTGRLEVSGGNIIATGTRQGIYNDGGTVIISGTANISSSSSERSAVQNKGNGTITITGGTITSNNLYAIYNESGTLTIGTKDNAYDPTTPVIQGKTYGIVANSTYNLYDGIIKGETAPLGTTSDTGNTPSVSTDTNGSKIADLETGAVKLEGQDGNYKTLYCTMTPSVITITFNAAGGNISFSSKQINGGEQIGALPTGTKGLFTLDGWYTGQDGSGTKISTSTTPIADITYYANWIYVSSDEIVEFSEISDVLTVYYNNVASWKNDSSTFQSNMIDNFYDHGCMCAASSDSGNTCVAASGGSNSCDKPNGFDTGMNAAVNVFMSDEDTLAKGSQVNYAHSSSGIIYNLIPGETYKWELASDSSVYGYVRSTQKRRILETGSMRNTRDLGGMPVDVDDDETIDGYLKYGRLMRGQKLGTDSANITELLNLGITEEVDLRKSSEVGSDVKLSNNNAGIYKLLTFQHYQMDIEHYPTYYAQDRAIIKQIMEDIVGDPDNSVLGENIYFHCRIGADRTGSVAYVLEGLLGVPNEDKFQDYELTVFAGQTNRHRYYSTDPTSSVSKTEKFRYMYDFMEDNDEIYEWYMKAITEDTSLTQQEKAELIAEEDELIQKFRDAMIDYRSYIKLSPKSEMVYNGDSQAANTANVIIKGNNNYSGTITYTYYSDDECSENATTTAPTNAGNYYVKASIASQGDIPALESSCVAHTIAKSNTTTSATNQTALYSGSMAEVTGTTSALSSNNSAITGGTYTYTFYNGTSCDVAGVLPMAPTNPGSYSFKATLDSTNNYNSSTSSCATYTITDTSATVTINKNDSSWSNSGMNVELRTSSAICANSVVTLTTNYDGSTPVYPGTEIIIYANMAYENLCTYNEYEWQYREDDNDDWHAIDMNFTGIHEITRSYFSYYINTTNSQYTYRIVVTRIITNPNTYSYNDATTSGDTVEWNTVVPSTYAVYVSKDENHLNTLVDSGINVTVSDTGAATVNYYDLTMTGTDSTLSLNGTNVTSGNSVAVAGGVAHTILSTPNANYSFAGWTVGSGTATIGDTSSDTTTVTINSSSTISATAIQP